MEARSGRLVRPLLGVTRQATGAWCRARGLAWRDDATNESEVYARGRVRAGLVPALRAIHPAAERNVVRTADLLRDEAEVLDIVVDTALAGRDRIAVGHLAALPRALGRLVLRRLAEAATGELCARAPGRLDDVLALRDGALDLGAGARAVVEDGILRCERTPPLPVARA
jgi:tRNA(Ile)-lysidine synthase